MITVTKTQIVANLAIEVKDPSNLTFSPEEMLYAVERSIEDPLVYSLLDINIPRIAQRTYALDDHVKAVNEIGLDTGSGFEAPLSHRLWRHRTGDNTIVLDRSAKNLAAGTLVAQVSWKYTSTDAIPSFLQEYVLQLSIIKLIDILSNTKITRFLKNDTTMGEMMGKVNEARGNVQVLKNSLRHNEAVRL